jgi:hypothetical protein
MIRNDFNLFDEGGDSVAEYVDGGGSFESARRP